MKIFHANRKSVKLSSLLSILLLVQCTLLIVHAAIATTEKCSLESASSDSTEGIMNLNANPCTDFFDYACGNWHLPYALRALQAHDSLTAASASNKKQLLQYFDGHVDGEAQQEDELVKREEQKDSISSTVITNQPHYTVRTFFKSCTEQTSDRREQHNIAKVFMAALQELNASRILNHSLISNDDNQLTHDVEWWQIAAEMRVLGVQTFWQLLLRPNWQSSEQQIFYLMPPKFGYMQHANVYDKINTQSVENEEIIFLQKRYIKYLLLDLGLRIRPAIKLANELVEFELALMQLNDHEDSLILNAPQTLEAWSQQLPELHLQAYFQTLHALGEPSLQEQHDVILEQMLLVVDIKYLQKLQKFLTTAEPHLVARYMIIKFLTHFELHLNVDLGYMENKLYCLQQLQTFLPRELTQLFFELKFNNSEQYIHRMHSDLNGLFDKLKSQFESLLQQTTIFENDASAKIMTLEKLHAMRLILPQLQQVAAIKTDYNLTKDYSQNLLKIWRVRVQRELAQLKTSVYAAANISRHDDLLEFPTDDGIYAPLDVNAYYRLTKNSIELPVGMLSETFYSACMPRPQIYGRLIYIMAHELLHGYDYDGLNYDKAGNVGDSLSPKTIIKYGTRASCYFEKRYTDPQLNINENIADSEGLRLALATMLAELNQGENIKQQDLKLFFLNFAQTWCGAEKPNGSHAKHRERVNNVVSNFEEFSTIYKCDNTTILNPLDKCQIW